MKATVDGSRATRAHGCVQGATGQVCARQRTNARIERDVRQTCAPVAKARSAARCSSFNGSFPAQAAADRAGTSRQDRQSLFQVSDIFRR